MQSNPTNKGTDTMTVTVYTKPAVRHEALSSIPEMKGLRIGYVAA